jgi:two-component system cell cycle response regulator CpdR
VALAPITRNLFATSRLNTDTQPEATMNNLVPSLALVVEDDQFQREMLSDLLRDEHMEVIACESAEAAELVLEQVGDSLCVLVTDVELAGTETGIELAGNAKRYFPELNVVIVSGRDHLLLPPDVHFLKKPWRPLDLLREAMG